MSNIIAVSSILHNTTGQSQVDNLLRGLIGLCELAFPQRVRAYYLVGSYADGSAVGGSDVDVRIVFRDDFREELQQRDREHRLRALRRMQRIVYTDQGMLEAIRSVTAEDAELSEARAATLHIYERNNSCLLSQSDA
ncbi:MAG: nucleotidyltransferase domain-containing protein [Chloroflexi bacterium]|nr:nucleotidyltransferase domain-containing protein [Chloroflexota bacterium]